MTGWAQDAAERQEEAMEARYAAEYDGPTPDPALTERILDSVKAHIATTAPLTDDEFYERQAAGLPMTAPLDLDVIRARLAADAADAADQTYDKHDPYGTSAPYARDVAGLLAEVERLTKERDEAHEVAELLQDGRKDLGRLQLLRVFIEQGAKGDPGGYVGTFCAEVLRQVDAAGEPRPSALQSEGATPEVTP